MEHHQHSALDDEPVVREQSTYLTDSRAASLCTLFSDGLDSGMGYTRIIDMLERQGYSDKLVGRLRESILEDGDQLAEAFARFGLLDPTARKLLLAAEQQGSLPTTFRDLGDHYSKRHKRRKKFVLSLVEPCILIALGFILARNVVSGDFEAFVESMDVVQHLKPIAVKSALEIGIFGSTAFLSGLVFLNLPVDMSFRSTVHRLWIRLPIPPFNKASRLHSIAVFCGYLRRAISSGLTVHHALALAAEASDNPQIESKIDTAREAIQQGQTLAQALKKSQALPREAVDYIDVGEESGHLEERLEELADRYGEQADENFRIKRVVMTYVLRLLVIITVITSLLATVAAQMGGILPT